MVYACKTSCAKSIIGVVPYFPYSKQCKMRKRGSIVSKLLASMMCKAGKNVAVLKSEQGGLLLSASRFREVCTQVWTLFKNICQAFHVF